MTNLSDAIKMVGQGIWDGFKDDLAKDNGPAFEILQEAIVSLYTECSDRQRMRIIAALEQVPPKGPLDAGGNPL